MADGQGGGVGQAELCARGIEMVGEQGHVGAVQQAGAEVGAQPHLTPIIQPEGFDLASLVGMRAPKCARSGIVMQADDPRRGFQADIDPLRAVLEVPRAGGIDGVVAADESGQARVQDGAGVGFVQSPLCIARPGGGASVIAHPPLAALVEGQPAGAAWHAGPA